MRTTQLPTWSDVWNVLVLLAGATLLVVGLLFSSAYWGMVMAIAAGTIMAVCIVGLVLSQPSIALLGSILACCGGLLAAGLSDQTAMWSSPAVTAGLLGLVGLGLIGVGRVLAPHPEASGLGLKAALEELREASLLSDTAKRVLYRDRELDLLRQTIEEDIDRGDFNAGLVLCQDLEQLFGYTEEAERLRHRVLLARNSQLAAIIDDEVASVQVLLDQGDVEKADAAAQRLHRLYPDSPALHGVHARVRASRQQQKRDLKQAFMESAQRGDTQGAMALLRQLDRQIDQDEAIDFQELAARVIAQHREALSVRFKLAVSDHRWSEALEAGTEIISDFPNDRMAVEVRDMLGRLQERAAAEAVSP